MLLLPSLSLVLSTSTLALAAKHVAAASASAANNPDSSAGKTLYVTSPACGFYKCVVTWPKGLKVNINWLLPPAGDVSVSLVSNTGGAVYVITPSMSGTGTACDAGGGPGVAVSGATCGGLDFIVPNNWVEASNYTIQVQSLTTTTDVGYTDAITITAANSTTADSTVSAVSVIGATSAAGSSAAGASASSAGASASSGSSRTSSSATSSGSASAVATKSSASASAASSSATGSPATRVVAGGTGLAALLVAAVMAIA